MDRRSRLSNRAAALALAAAAAALAGCGAATPASPTGARVTTVARGSLGYAVAFAGDHLLALELGERFELVVRDGDGDAELGRLDLGGPERDWTALAATGDRAWVGGEAGEIRAVALTDAAHPAVIATWPVGAAITALAASDGRVAIGDADGVLCLRRGDDGALLQCVAAHDHPVAALAVDGERLISRGDDARAWHLPDLARGVGVDRIGVQWAGGEVVVDGAAVDLVADGHRSRVIEMAGPVHGVAVSPDGRLAVAAWITQLDQPSIVLIAPPGPPRPRDRMGR